MDRNKKKIISIGGGGFTHETDESLDQFVLSKLNTKNFKIGFLPTASKDNQKKIDLFYKRFENSNLELSHFSLCSKIEGFKGWLLSKDIIYVGGGNTFYMLEIWEKNNLISGSCTPHSSEDERINQFQENIKNNKLPEGIAIDDGVAVLFIDGKATEVYSSRKNHDAYYINKSKKISLKEHIKTIYE